MGTERASGAAQPAPQPAPETAHPAARRALAVLCVTEVTSWGVLYYAFPVLLGPLTADTGWSPTGASAAFSAGLVASAVAGVPVGRWLDAAGPRRVMTAGSLLAVPATVAVALAPTFPLFVLAWLVAGVAMAAVFYQAAFAALARLSGPDRVRAMTVLTLAAGLSSTVFAPLTHALSTVLDWRATYLVLAAVLAVVPLPLHALGLPSARGHGPAPPPSTGGRVPAEVRTPPFLLLAAALTVCGLGVYAVSLLLIPLLTHRGLSSALAATTLGLLGGGQLLGRLVFGPLRARTTPTGRTVAVVAATAGTLAVLAFVPGPAPLLVAAAVLVGAARGAGTLLQATVVVDRWGTGSYATLSGWFSAPVTLAIALAPWCGTALAGLTGGPATAVGVLAAVVAAAALPAVAAGRASFSRGRGPTRA